MKIIIAEGGASVNIGSMALIENATRIAYNLDEKCKLVVLTSDVDGVREKLNRSLLNNAIDVRNDLFHFPRSTFLNKLLWLITNVLWIIYMKFILCFTDKPYKFLIGRKARLLREIHEADYIFCIGAERINDIYYKTVYFSLEALQIYEKMKKKLVHFSLTIGPVFYKSTIKKVSKVFNNSYAIFVRDQKSFDLLNELDAKKTLRFNSYDIAILQNKLVDDRILLDELGIDDNYICVSVIHWLFRKVRGPVRQLGYNRAVAETLDYIIEKYDKNIVFTPTVVEEYKIDDVKAGESIIKLMKNKERIVQIKKLLTPAELATVYSCCKFAIVTRMHAAILCSGAGNRPIIAINYLYKLREYMKNIGFEDYSVDIDYVTSEHLKCFVDRMMQNYENNQLRLTQQMDCMKSILLDNINLIAKEVKIHVA